MRKTITTESGVKRTVNLLTDKVYCAGIEKLAKILNVTEDEARELKRKFFEERRLRK